jgi:hypothetical protein
MASMDNYVLSLAKTEFIAKVLSNSMTYVVAVLE